MFTSTYDDFFEIISALPGLPEEFSPKLGAVSQVDPRFLWVGLPSDLRSLPHKDQKVVEQVWLSMIQSASGILEETLYTQQSLFLADAPLVRPKKWVRFPFRREYLLGVDFPEWTPKTNITTYSRAPVGTDAMEVFVQRTEQLNRVSTELPNPCTCDVHVEVTATLPHQSLVGFPQFQLGIFQSTDNFRPNSGIFFCVEEALGRWELKVVELTDDDRRVVTLGSTTSPTDQIRVTWDPVRREAEYDLMGISGVYPVPGRFRVSEVGFTSSTYEGLLPPSGLDQTTSFLLTELTILQTSINPSVRYLPTLQAKLSDSTTTLAHLQDYWVRTSEDGAMLQFRDRDAIPDYAWAEYVGEQSFSLRDDWGKMLDIPYGLINRENSETFRNLLLGLFYGLLHGPHVTPIYAAISALAGVPVCMGDGIVTGLYDRQGTPAVVVREAGRSRVYYYADYITLTVKPGDHVKYLQLLGDSGTVFTWGDGNPMLNIVKSMLGAEVEKYKYLLIQYPVELVDRFESREDLEEITRAYLREALPLWVGIANATFLYLIHLRDHLRMEDEFLIPEETANLFDDLSLAQDPLIYASPKVTYYNGTPPRKYGEMHLREDGDAFDESVVNLRDELEIA